MQAKEKNIKDLNRVVGSFFGPEFKIGAMRYFLSFLGVLVFGSILIVSQGENPVKAVLAILEGAFGSTVAFGNTLRWATPCMLTGAAAIVALKSGVINLGIEGQMFVGALAAGFLGFVVELPAPIHAILCIISAGIAGTFWVIIPAMMRLFFSINEYVTTMMMNFVATLFCDYIIVWHIIPAVGGTTVTIASPNIEKTARLSTLIKGTSSSTGFIIAVVIALLVYVIYKYTIKGYELKQVGENLKFAQIGGVNVKKTFISIFVLSGFIAGVCGGVEVTGGYYRYVSNFSLTMGWEGIMIANISNRNPIALIFVSLIWGALKTGAMAMERSTSLNRLTVNLLQMLFVILVSIDYEGIANRYKDKKRKKAEAAQLLAAQGGER